MRYPFTKKDFIFVSAPALFACGDSVPQTEDEKGAQIKEGCEGVKTAECPADPDWGFWAAIDSCALNVGDCMTFEEGEDECKTSITCELINNGAGCNNQNLVCYEGYQPSDCTIGEGSCIEAPHGWGCLESNLGCQCSTCEYGLSSLQVSNCDGRQDCIEIDSCGTTLSCAACSIECLNDEVVVSSCDEGETCRELRCSEDPTLKYFCKPKTT